MQRKLLITVTILFCFAVCYAYPLSYNFEVNGSVITGTARGPVGTFIIDSGKIDSANNSQFVVTVGGVNILHQGKFYNDSIGMNFTCMGQRRIVHFFASTINSILL